MRVLVVAFLCALAITARSQCSKDSDCSNGGTCSANTCTCSSFKDNGITRQYSGPTCKDFTSWWYTNSVNTVKQTSTSCQTKFSTISQTCNGKGDLENEVCRCKTYYDGNVTIEYHGECCQNWFSSWHTSSGQSKTDGKDIAMSACDAARTCSNHGSCTTNGTCVCQRTVSGNRTTEYFGSNCNSYHSWWWWWNSTSKSYQRQDLWGVGNAWAGDGIGMSQSRQEYYCWCANTTATAGSSGLYPCIAWCEKSYTCNNHGNCKNDKSETCTCDPNFTGKWCDQCKTGWGNTNSSDPTKLCNICAPGWYPAGVCNTQCIDDVMGPGCGGHGRCNSAGTCDCDAGYAGKYCTECAIEAGYMTSNGRCEVCTSAGTCSNNGVCHWNGTCACGTGFKGAKCDQCSVGGKYPKCDTAVARSGAAAGAASDECEGPNLALPIILSILGTLLIMLIAFAIYKVVSNKSAGAGGAGTAKSSNWSEFEKDSSTAYSQL